MTSPSLADRHLERAAVVIRWEHDEAACESFIKRDGLVSYHVPGKRCRCDERAIALTLAAVERETIERCENAVDEVARKFRAAHDPMSENAADECYAAIRALADRKEE
jgi:hypothetical protein